MAVESSLKIKFISYYTLVTGNGDVTYNSRRGFLGAIPVTGEIAYHLYGVTTGKVGNTVNFIRKFRWHSQQSTERSI